METFICLAGVFLCFSLVTIRTVHLPERIEVGLITESDQIVRAVYGCNSWLSKIFCLMCFFLFCFRYSFWFLSYLNVRFLCARIYVSGIEKNGLRFVWVIMGGCALWLLSISGF